MQVNRKKNDIPVSLEVIRRKVMLASHAVERETEVFRDRYLRNVNQSGNWSSFIDRLCSRDNRRFTDLEDFKDVDYLMHKYKSDPEIAYHPQFHAVKVMCERGKMFEYISFSLKNELEDGYEKLKKYCISFSAESDGHDLKSVRDYENKVINWEKDIAEKFEKLNEVLDQQNAMEKPLGKYLDQYDRVVEIMSDGCQQMLITCEPLKKWAMADAVYPRKIQDDINTFNRRKMDMRDIIKELEYQRDQLGLKLKRRTFHTVKVERMLADARDEKRYFKRRENTVKANYVRIEQETEQKRFQLDEVRDRVKNRKENSFTAFNYWTSLAEDLRSQIRLSEAKLETMRLQMDSLRNSQMGVQKDVDRLTAELEHMAKQQAAAEEQFMNQQRDIQLVKADVKNIDEKILVLKKIREIKLHSDTIKKIYHFGYHPGQHMEYKDELTEAFKLTAEEVGKDWVWLYQKLPFRPARDYKTRTHDIEVIDLSNRRVEKGFEHLALKSLEKWRRLSVSANVPELVKTLRIMKKKDVAKKIQKQLTV